MKKNRLKISELKGKQLTADQQLHVKGGSMAMARPTGNLIKFNRSRIEDDIDIRKPIVASFNTRF